MGITFCKTDYEKKGEVWVVKKFTMTSSFAQMGASKIEVEYKNIKINKGISDSIFEIK